MAHDLGTFINIQFFISNSDEKRKHSFPSSGELNFKVSDPAKCIEAAKNLFTTDAEAIDELMACQCPLKLAF